MRFAKFIIIVALVTTATAQESAPVVNYLMHDIPKSDPRFVAAFQSVLANFPPENVKPPVSINDFSDRLQMGEIFLIKKGKTSVQCKLCSGAGRIPIRDGEHRVGDGKRECSNCRGAGKVIVPQPVRICWK